MSLFIVALSVTLLSLLVIIDRLSLRACVHGQYREGSVARFVVTEDMQRVRIAGHPVMLQAKGRCELLQIVHGGRVKLLLVIVVAQDAVVWWLMLARDSRVL